MGFIFQGIQICSRYVMKCFFLNHISTRLDTKIITLLLDILLWKHTVSLNPHTEIYVLFQKQSSNRRLKSLNIHFKAIKSSVSRYLGKTLFYWHTIGKNKCWKSNIVKSVAWTLVVKRCMSYTHVLQWIESCMRKSWFISFVAQWQNEKITLCHSIQWWTRNIWMT